jgi:hypothetical protein
VFLAVGNPSRQGVHFRKNLQVTDQQSDESVNNPHAIGWYGDYEGLVAYGGVAHPVWCDARASNPLVGGFFREALYTAAVQYSDEDGGEGTESPAEPEFAGAAGGSSPAPAAAPAASARPQGLVGHDFAAAPGEGRAPAWAGLRLHSAHRRGDHLGDVLRPDDPDAMGGLRGE